ncbi:MAG: mechanosensitive ion channel family protein [Alphaproteobacteria bacterium]|nr:mechanosensitive ion channel family protein [Alphaproteobacteria bacterium]
MAAFINQHLSLILPILYKILLTGGILFASSVIARFIALSLDKGIHKIKNIDDTFLPVATLIIQYGIYGIGALFILNLFGINTASIVTLIGVGGLSIGFALKDAISNMASGLMLLFLRPFRNGDAVEIGGTVGTIKAIGLFTTRLQTFSGVYVCMPNNLFWTTAIINYSRNKKRRIEAKISLSYFDSLETAVNSLKQIIKEEPRFLEDPAPQILVKQLNFSAVQLELRGWVKTSEFWDVQWHINEQIKRCVETGILKPPLLRNEIYVKETTKNETGLSNL